MKSPPVDFGDSATIMKFQFQAMDMAGNISNSPVLTVAGAWMKSNGGGDIYVKDGISLSSSAIAGEYNGDGLVCVGNSLIEMFTSSVPYEVKNYEIVDENNITGIFPDFTQIKQRATPLPGGKMPDHNGLFIYNGDYTMDQNSMPSGFQGGVWSAVVIIDGDLSIKKEFEIKPESRLIFIVTGDIEILGSVGKISGAFFTDGIFNTNSDNKGGQKLIFSGSVMAEDNIVLGRDLGRKGNPNNTTTPAELITYQPKYLFDSLLGEYLGGSQLTMQWVEE